MTISPYGVLMLAAILVSIGFWSRVARRDQRLVWIYIGALIGAFVGAKVLYFLAEGWLELGRPNFWERFATGKTIVGGLLGGYAGVEIAKRAVRYPGVTGDWFAIIAPVGIIMGRFGCLLHGCCPGIECSPAWFTLKDRNGVERWPAVPLEIAFNLGAIAILFLLRQTRLLPKQHFHLYLIGYGVFRFLHEFLRAEPRLVGPFTGYHFASLALVGLGFCGFLGRRRPVGTPLAVTSLAADGPTQPPPVL